MLKKTEVSKDINDHKELLAGEFFDLTITSKNNIYGKIKIENSTKHGINIPLDYYYNEADKMTNNLLDKKYDKRMNRLVFLDLCLESLPIKEFFTFVINYLNGSDGITGYTTNTILVVSGGNIITIFAKLLFKIIIKKEDIKIYFSEVNASGLRILDEIIKALLEPFSDPFFYSHFIELLQEFENSLFSDLDFSLLPNKILKGGVKTKNTAKRTRKMTTKQSPRLYKTDKITKIKENLIKFKVNSINSIKLLEKTNLEYLEDEMQLYEFNNSYFKSIKTTLTESINEVNSNIKLIEKEIKRSNSTIEDYKKQKKEYEAKLKKANNELSRIPNARRSARLITIVNIDESTTDNIKQQINELNKNIEKNDDLIKKLKLQLKTLKAEKEKKKYELQEIDDKITNNEEKIKHLKQRQANELKKIEKSKTKTLNKFDQPKSDILARSVQSKLNDGVVIFRIKTKFPINYSDIKKLKLKITSYAKHSFIESKFQHLHAFYKHDNKSCSKKIDNINFRHLIPQLVQESWLQKTRDNECKNFIKKLLAKSYFIDLATYLNTYIISNSFTDDPLKNMIDIIHIITKELNSNISTIYKSIDNTIKVEDFDTLESISNSDLTLLSSKLVESFFQINEVKIVFQNIKNFYIETCNFEFMKINPFTSKCVILPCENHLSHITSKIRNNTKNYDDLKNKLKEDANYQLYKTNIYACINVIQPEYVNPSIFITEEEIAEFDKLIDPYNSMAISSLVEPVYNVSSSLKPATLGYGKHKKRKTKRKKTKSKHKKRKTKHKKTKKVRSIKKIKFKICKRKNTYKCIKKS